MDGADALRIDKTKTTIAAESELGPVIQNPGNDHRAAYYYPETPTA